MAIIKAKDKRPQWRRTVEEFRLLRDALDAIDSGFSMREVSKAVGIPVTTLQDIKKGRRHWFNEVKLR